MRRLLLIAVALSTASCAKLVDWWNGPPNVVVLIIDTVRADRLGTYGHVKAVTPKLDAFVAKGVVFDKAISQAPWTRPSIASMLTSQYPRTLGMYEEKDETLPEDITLMSEVFKNAGFRTIGVTANPNINTNFGFNQGYDVYVDSGAVWHWMDADDEQTKAPKTGLDPAPERFGQVLAALEAETPEEAAQKHFVMIDVMEAHEWRKPEILRPEFADLFEGDPDAAYLRTLAQLDEDVDAFLTTLLARDGWDDTVVVIVSDHGEGLSSHPGLPKSMFHGRHLYASQVWVPLMMVPTRPSRLPQTRVAEPVRVMDMMPTVLDLAGLQVPPEVQGSSLLPRVLDPEAPLKLPEFFMLETHFRGTDKLGAYNGTWLYVHNRDKARKALEHELQDFEVDALGARSDVGKDHPRALRRLKAFTAEWDRLQPSRPVTRPEHGPTDAEIKQLESLGYVQ